uniref:LIM zinc-binding domain-containing protein n=1 Tax=Mola mola TaxID=94237 RepID=A0A3Q3X7M3_MOLML
MKKEEALRTLCLKEHKYKCTKVIFTTLGEVWHPEHFVCVECKMELSTTGFFERDGRPYCNKDYHHLFSPRCGFRRSSFTSMHLFSKSLSEC